VSFEGFLEGDFTGSGNFKTLFRARVSFNFWHYIIFTITPYWRRCSGSALVEPCGSNRKDYIMPKVKTNSSAKKRFKVTGTGEITFQKAFKRHILTKKSTKRKRAMRKKGLVGSTNKDFVLRLLRLKG